MRKKIIIVISLFILLGLAIPIIYQIPAVNQRLFWRVDAAQVFIRRILDPVGDVPTPIPNTPIGMAPTQTNTEVLLATPTSPRPTTPTKTPLETQTPSPTLEPTPTRTPLPVLASVPSPAWEKQDWNNCGPATLSLYLKTYGWGGDQFTISDLHKPDRGDKNVNVEELVFFVRNNAGWLNADFRVGGDIPLLKSFIASGIPIMIEEGYYGEIEYYPNDDRWLGHYLLLTGFDDDREVFIVQDTFLGADREVSYQTLDAGWQTFNRVFLFLYLPDDDSLVQDLLGPDWDPEMNRQRALERSNLEIERDQTDPFAWFNLGSNLVYFERYAEAAEAYDQARQLGLPQRMLRYQFGPFFAYFHSGRNEELLALTDYALKITNNSEETLLWRGWGEYRAGNAGVALQNFYAALEANPYYLDAQYAIDFVSP